jgi:hypothetical protein
MFLQIMKLEYFLNVVLYRTNKFSFVLPDKGNAKKMGKLWEILVFSHK